MTDAKFLEVDFSVRFLGFLSAAKRTAGLSRWILVILLLGFRGFLRGGGGFFGFRGRARWDENERNKKERA